VWSVGCILAELLGGRPFFKGRDYVDQLNQILHYLGTPNEETLSRIGSPRAQEYVRNLPFMAKVSFARLFPNANPDALDLLDRMLAFDPSSRISVEEALEHRYLHIWHDASDEPNCPRTFDFAFEVVEDVPEMRKMILEEVQRFRTHVRQQPHQAIAGKHSFITTPIPQENRMQRWKSSTSIVEPHFRHSPFRDTQADKQQAAHNNKTQAMYLFPTTQANMPVKTHDHKKQALVPLQAVILRRISLARIECRGRGILPEISHDRIVRILRGLFFEIE
jgi:serine/threonine protein kinase